MKRIHFLTGLPALLLAGCVTPASPIPISHPASPAAAESSTAAAEPRLAADEDSRRTQSLLDERARQAEAAETNQPAEGPENPPKMEHSGMSMGQ